MRPSGRGIRRIRRVPTGAISFDVLDVDPKNGGKDWYLAHRDRLPQTRVHRTRSGGLHCFLSMRRASQIEQQIAPGIDVRADGGYVIWWPATGLPVRDDALPEWPLWLLPALMSPPKPPPPVYAKPIACSSDFHPQYVRAAVEEELSAVAFAPEGSRNETLHRAAVKLAL